MSSDSPPPPPKDYFKQYTPGAVGKAYGGISDFASMPNYGQQTLQQYQPTFAGSAGASGWDPSQAVQNGNSMVANSQALNPYVAQLFQMGMDPQGDYFNMAAHDLTERTNAELGKRGIAQSPYGAGVVGETLGRFSNDWRNQQMGRAVQGAGAAGSLQGQINQGVQGGTQLSAQVPQWQAQIAQMMSQLGNNAYAFPQQTINDWMNFSNMGTSSANNRYQAQFQNYSAEQAADNAMWGGIGNLFGNAVGAAGDAYSAGMFG